MKYISLFLMILYVLPLMTAEHISKKCSMFQPIINNKKIPLDEYREIVDSFRNLNFRVSYDVIFARYKVLICSRENPALYWFAAYKTVIMDAYQSIKNRNLDRMMPGDPAGLLYSHIRLMKAWPANSAYTTPDLELKQKVWNAFKNEDMNSLCRLLESKNS